jgi:uncharacterized protein
MTQGRPTGLRAIRIRHIGWMTLWWCSVHGAWASTEETFRRGELAYQRGDLASAMTTLRISARDGHAASQTLLAFILENADFAEEAARLYAAAAAQGHAQAHAGLAHLYQTGRGIAKDENKALEHFSKAAELGHSQSLWVLADALLKGQLGLSTATTDPARKLDLLQRAAAQGHLPSAEALATAYRAGTLGLAADPAQADRWQARAVELRRLRAAPGAAPAAKGRT